eukprot:2235348-Rhodomonas_salina.5
MRESGHDPQDDTRALLCEIVAEDCARAHRRMCDTQIQNTATPHLQRQNGPSSLVWARTKSEIKATNTKKLCLLSQADHRHRRGGACDRDRSGRSLPSQLLEDTSERPDAAAWKEGGNVGRQKLSRKMSLRLLGILLTTIGFVALCPRSEHVHTARARSTCHAQTLNCTAPGDAFSIVEKQCAPGVPQFMLTAVP